MDKIKEFARVDVLLRLFAAGINLLTPILFFYAASAEQYIELIQFLALSRIFSVVFVGQQEHLVFKEASDFNRLPIHYGLLIVPLFVLILVSVGLIADSNVLSLMSVAVLLYCNAIMLGFVSAKYTKIGSAKIIICLSLARLIGYLSVFYLTDNIIITVILAELCALVLAVSMTFPITIRLTKTSKLDLFNGVLFGSANGLRILRDNTAIILITTLGSDLDAQFLASIVLSITIYNALVTMQAILCQSSWHELGSRNNLVVLEKYNGISRLMILAFFVVTGLQYIFLLGADFVFQVWFPFCVVYYFVLFLTGPKFFLSKLRTWTSLESIEAGIGLIAILIVYGAPSSVSLAAFYVLVMIPHIYGYVYVSRKLYPSIS